MSTKHEIDLIFEELNRCGVVPPPGLRDFLKPSNVPAVGDELVKRWTTLVYGNRMEVEVVLRYSDISVTVDGWGLHFGSTRRILEAYKRIVAHLDTEAHNVLIKSPTLFG